MSVIATIDVAADDFGLGGALTADSDLHVRLERVVPLGLANIPHVRVSDGSVEVIEAALRADVDVESFRVVETVADETRIHVEWTRDVGGLLEAMARTGATILEGAGHDGVWTLRLRFDDHEDLAAFSRRCTERGISLDLGCVHDPGVGAAPGSGRDITDPQREALQLAHERGYFDVPRRVTLTELATELGISDTGASERIRRGLTTLLLSTFGESDGGYGVR